MLSATDCLFEDELITRRDQSNARGKRRRRNYYQRGGLQQISSPLSPTAAGATTTTMTAHLGMIQRSLRVVLFLFYLLSLCKNNNCYYGTMMGIISLANAFSARHQHQCIPSRSRMLFQKQQQQKKKFASSSKSTTMLRIDWFLQSRENNEEENENNKANYIGRDTTRNGSSSRGGVNAAKKQQRSKSWSSRRRRQMLRRQSAIGNVARFMIPPDSRLQVTLPPNNNSNNKKPFVGGSRSFTTPGDTNNSKNGIWRSKPRPRQRRNFLPRRQRRRRQWNNNNDNDNNRDPFDIKNSSSSSRSRRKNFFRLFSTQARISFYSIGRVIVPSLIATALGVQYYDDASKFINTNWLDSSSIQFLSSDEIQFIPSFLTVISLLFSILAGDAFSSLYDQQETVYFALYREVSEAKSLLEQMTLVCSGRPFYGDALRMMKIYVSEDLLRIDVPPSDLIAKSPAQDPLEAIMYLTSVGVPSSIYETVRDLRQARGYRLGAMQRKFPRLGLVLLWILALLELAAFPLLGAGTIVDAPESIFNVQGALFGGLCGATTLVLRIIQELWRTSGGAFNVDPILNKMVKGLSEELDKRERMNNDATAATSSSSMRPNDNVQRLGNEFNGGSATTGGYYDYNRNNKNTNGGDSNVGCNNNSRNCRDPAVYAVTEDTTSVSSATAAVLQKKNNDDYIEYAEYGNNDEFGDSYDDYYYDDDEYDYDEDNYYDSPYVKNNNNNNRQQQQSPSPRIVMDNNSDVVIQKLLSRVEELEAKLEAAEQKNSSSSSNDNSKHENQGLENEKRMPLSKDFSSEWNSTNNGLSSPKEWSTNEKSNGSSLPEESSTNKSNHGSLLPSANESDNGSLSPRTIESNNSNKKLSTKNDRMINSNASSSSSWKLLHLWKRIWHK